MPKQYSQNFVIMIILIAIIIIACFFVYFTYRPLPVCPANNQWCIERQAGSLGNASFTSKYNLTNSEKKLSTDLLQLIGTIKLPDGITREVLEQQMKQNHQFKVIDSSDATVNGTTGHKLIYVYISILENADLNPIKANISNITNADPANHLIVAWVDVDNLISLASIDSVKSIRTVIPPMIANNP